jgi:hypothetical protein
VTPIVKKSRFREVSAQILDELRHLGLLVMDNFSTMTSPIIALFRFIKDDECMLNFSSLYYAEKKNAYAIESKLRENDDYCRSWIDVTNNHNHSVIERLIGLGSNQEDQLALLRYIRASYSNISLLRDSYFLEELEERIEEGKFKTEEIPSTHRFYSQLLNPEEQSQYRQYLCLDRVAIEQNLNEKQFLDKEKEEAIKANTPELLVSEMVEYVKKNYSKSAASEFCTMCYRLLLRQGGRIDEATAQMLDEIDSAIIQRDAPQQKVNIQEANQVNINPKEVNNN